MYWKKISKEIDSSDVKNIKRERTRPNFMELNFQTRFRSLVSKFIYSWKRKAFCFKSKGLVLKTDSSYTTILVKYKRIRTIYGLSFLPTAHGLYVIGKSLQATCFIKPRAYWNSFKMLKICKLWPKVPIPEANKPPWS